MASPKVFAARLSGLANAIELNSGDAFRNLVGTILVTVVAATPVGGPPTSPKDIHPGLARSNWQVFAGVQSAFVTLPAAAVSDVVSRGLTNVRLLRHDGVATISNAALHIRALDAGWSSQAPAGFVQASADAGFRAARRVQLLRRRR